MALTQAVIGEGDIAGKKTVFGSFLATSVTGGDIETGLDVVEFFSIQLAGSAVEAAQAVVNETLPLVGGDVTFVCSSGDTGYWMAVGH